MRDYFTIGVFYTTKEFIQSFAEKILSEIDNTEILFATKHNIALKGGITYRFYRANDNGYSTLGWRIDRAYVEQTVNDDYVNNIIRPMLFSRQQIIRYNIAELKGENE